MGDAIKTDALVEMVEFAEGLVFEAPDRTVHLRSIATARAELVALVEAATHRDDDLTAAYMKGREDGKAQPMTVNVARKVLPSGEWIIESSPHFWSLRNNGGDIDLVILIYTDSGIVTNASYEITRAQRDAAEVLFYAMRGDSEEARDLRKEYAG